MHYWRSLRYLVAGAVLGSACSLAQLPPAPAARADFAPQQSYPPQSIPPLDKDLPAANRYRVESDDVLSISFALSPELNQAVMVHPDGFISLINVGSMHVVGLTIPEIVAALRTAYSPTMQDPIIDVDLKEYHRPVFYVMGQVSKPGQYDLRYRLSVLQALAVGGGFAPSARTQVVLIHRVSTKWAEVKVLDLRNVGHRPALDRDVLVSSGDMIFVPEKAITKFRKYVPYGLGLDFSPGGSFLF